MKKEMIYKIILTLAVFWSLDFILHFTGVGESNYYYIIKLANSALFAFIWFSIYNKKSHTKKFIFALVFGTWVSFFYVLSSYSGFVQFLGIPARYSPPPFLIFGYTFPAFFWWIFHILAFFIGLEVSGIIKEKK